MSKNQFTLLHRPSRNFLDWWDTLDEAIAGRNEWVADAPHNEPDLELWDDVKGVQIELDPETGQPATAA